MKIKKKKSKTRKRKTVLKQEAELCSGLGVQFDDYYEESVVLLVTSLRKVLNMATFLTVPADTLS